MHSNSNYKSQSKNINKAFNRIKRVFCISLFLQSAVFVLSFFCITDKTIAVGGISNSKVIVPNTETVPSRRFEIEPFFGLVVVDDKDKTVGFEAGGRFTLGALENFEFGANVGYLSVEDTNVIGTEAVLGNIEAGMKYRFFDQGDDFRFSLAYEGGITFPTSSSDELWVFEPVGFIFTRNFGEYFSMDADIVVALIGDQGFGVTSEVGFGYFVKSWFQPVIEAAYSLEDLEGDDSKSVINITAGFTAPVTEMITIILGVTPDVYTKNTDNKILVSLAFTFLF